MNSKRLIIDTKVYDKFAERCRSHGSSLGCGKPSEPDTVIAPAINRNQLERMPSCVQGACHQRAHRVLGGDPNGLALPPPLFINIADDVEIARIETFWPLAPLMRVDGEDEQLRMANDTEQVCPARISPAIRRAACGLR